MRKPARAVAKDDPIPSLRPVPQDVRGEVVETFDCEQGSEEWFNLRLGMCTASNFSKIMAQGDGKVRSRLMRQLAGELLTGRPAETYKSAAMQRGNDMEAAIRERYAFTHDVELHRVGFVRRSLSRGRFIGCSPDSLIGNDGVLEIKSMIPELLIELLETGRFPTEHRAQAHGSLWVTGRSYCELVIGYEGMPTSATFTVQRDDAVIHTIEDAVEAFDWELKKMVERIRNMAGGKR